MKRYGAIQQFCLTCMAGLACITLSFAAGAPSTGAPIAKDTSPTVNVGVYALHSGGKIAYHYRVINNTQQTISVVTIGRNKQSDGAANNDIYELVELPSGWNEKFGIPAASYNAPTGWRVNTIAPEEESMTHAISWEPLNDKSPKLLAGQTLAKMSVTLDKADFNYLAGHALITFADGYPDLTVPLEPLDYTPPSLVVNLSPNTILPQENKFVAINASFTVKDDYDRMPEIKLESITANEPLETDDIRDANIGLDDRYLKFRAISKSASGRVYTVTYSATDASGNQTTASATVTVTATSAPLTTPVASVAPITRPVTSPLPGVKQATAPGDQGEKKKP